MISLLADNEFMQLFQGCFAMDPSQKLTCEQLLNRPYFDRYDIYSDKNRQRGQRDQRVRITIILLFVLGEIHSLVLRQLFMWCFFSDCQFFSLKYHYKSYGVCFALVSNM